MANGIPGKFFGDKRQPEIVHPIDGTFHYKGQLGNEFERCVVVFFNSLSPSILVHLYTMQFSSSLLENAVNEFAKLPGIGKKTALRLVLHLLKEDTEDVQHFSEVISRMRNDIKFCQRCHNVADADICSICANSMRRQEMICVVENIRDVIALESTQQYNGTYHVLGGVISPLDG